MNDARDSTGRFRPGRSGNPRGRPRTSAQYRAMLAGLADDALRVLREALNASDVGAAQFIFGRLTPSLRPVSDPVTVTLPDGPLSERGEAILRAMASGRLSADECSTLIAALESQRKLVEQSEILPVIERLEAAEVNRR